MVPERPVWKEKNILVIFLPELDLVGQVVWIEPGGAVEGRWKSV